MKVTELFLVKCGNDWTRTFVGTLHRCKNENGNDVYRCRVVINEGYIIGMAYTREELGNKLDEICKLKLDFHLHEEAGITSEIFGLSFSQN